MMKSLFTLCCLMPFLAFGQGEISVSIKVEDSKQKPLSGATVSLLETATNKRIDKKTDAMGKTSFVLNEGNVWKVLVNNYDMDRAIEVPPSGRAQKSMLLTYNPVFMDRKENQSKERGNIQWEKQSFSEDLKPIAGKGVLRIRVLSKENTPLSGICVRVVDSKANKGYEAVSGKMGLATFLVDLGKGYDVDVAESINLSFIDIKARPGIMLTHTVHYTPSAVIETQKGDTIIQEILKNEPSSASAYYEVIVFHTTTIPAAKERVYLQQLKGAAVYMAVTDDNGKARFLLPLGYSYMVHFDFHPDVDIINLKKSYGYVHGAIELVYRPNPRLKNPELFLPDLASLFLLNYENFVQKKYPAPKPSESVGLFLNWGNSINAKSSEALLEIGLSSKGMNSMPGNYSFVIDKSGSMEGHDRMELLKEALIELVASLQPNDYVSVFVYNTQMEMVFPHQLLGNKKSQLIDAIKAIEAGGGTQMREALLTAYQSVLKQHSLMRNNRIIVLSDGYDFEESSVLEAVQVPFNEKIICSTIGVGGDYNYGLLNGLAQKGGGNLYQLNQSSDFKTVFLPGIKRELYPAAFAVSMEIQVPDGLTCEVVYGKQVLGSGKQMLSVKLPTLHDGESRVLLVRFKIDKPGEKIEGKEVQVRIRYKEKPDGQEKMLEQRLPLVWTDGEAALKSATDAELKKLYAIAELNRSVERMAVAQAKGDFATAAKVLNEGMARVSALYEGEKMPIELLPFFEEVRAYQQAVEAVAKKRGN